MPPKKTNLLAGLAAASLKPKAPLVREFFRCEVTTYLSNGAICQTVKFRPLKQISIREPYQGLQGHIDHYGAEDTISHDHGVLHFPADPEHNRIYEAVCCDDGPDYETGIIENYWFELRPVPKDDPLIQVKHD